MTSVITVTFEYRNMKGAPPPAHSPGVAVATRGTKWCEDVRGLTVRHELTDTTPHQTGLQHVRFLVPTKTNPLPRRAQLLFPLFRSNPH